ncbi:MAG: signal transduction histidine kinase [Flammeovirgaceae bacterium]|jgi:signal transduction histidine kinase
MSNRCTILVVDDERANLMVLMELLSNMGENYRVISAPNGKIACDLALSKQPHVIVMDWEMPEMNGIEALKKLKANPETSDIPVIMATAVRTDTENVIEALEAGASDYVRKPIEMLELQTRVKSALKLSISLKQIKEQNKVLSDTLKELQSSHLQLTQSEKMATVGTLTAGIAHEINNPVNFIQNGVESISIILKDLFDLLDKYDVMLAKENLSESFLSEIKNFKEEMEYEEVKKDGEEMVAHLKDGANRTSEIASLLKNYSRKDASEMVRANVHDGIDATLVLLKHHLTGRINIVREFDTNIPPLYCFPNQMNQVFMNLIHNSIQAIENEGEIKIKTSHNAERLFVEVTDSGIGMSEEVQKKIFEPFFTTKDVNKGTGLGMSITKDIIEKHEGIVEIRSKVGSGTTFILSFPIREEKEELD